MKHFGYTLYHPNPPPTPGIRNLQFACQTGPPDGAMAKGLQNFYQILDRATGFGSEDSRNTRERNC